MGKSKLRSRRFWTILATAACLFVMAGGVAWYLLPSNSNSEETAQGIRSLDNSSSGLPATHEQLLLQLRNDLAKIQNELKEEKALKLQTIASLETALREKQLELTTLGTDIGKQKIENSRLLATQDSVAKLAKILRAEVDGSKDQPGLRQTLIKLQNERDSLYTLVLNLTDAINQEKGKNWRIRQTNIVLQDRVIKLKKVLNHVGVDPNKPLPPRAVPPPVRGLVRKVDKSGKVVELTIGSDDGLRVGHTMEVFNQKNQYLGRVKIVKVMPDKAVGQVIIHRGKIRRGDYVATKLNKSDKVIERTIGSDDGLFVGQTLNVFNKKQENIEKGMKADALERERLPHVFDLPDVYDVDSIEVINPPNFRPVN